MRIVDVRETTASMRSDIRNAYVDFREMTTSVVAVVTDVVRGGRPVVGYGFNSNGRYAVGGLLRERFIPRLLRASPEALRADAGANLDPHRIWNVLMAAILFATFKFAASADVKFKVALAIVMFASLPLIIKSLLAMLSVGAGASADSFTFQNPIASNPGYFINPADSRWLYSLGTALDIFMVWTLALTAIGFSSVSRL